jgi:hypothetical protein
MTRKEMLDKMLAAINDMQLDQEIKSNGKLFLSLIPENYELPNDGVEELSGDLELEWYKNPRFTLSVSIGLPDKNLNNVWYAGLFGGDETSVHGSFILKDAIDENLLLLIDKFKGKLKYDK